MGLTLPGLRDAIVARSAAALAAGALVPIETERQVVEDGGLRFLVRVAHNLRRKARLASPSPPVDPFDPPEAELTLGPAGPHHLLVLNKFNVVDHHLLVVTRTFVDQDQRLDLADLEALWACLEQIDGLGFYNGGTEAGASQRHKHLQLVPAPVGGAGGRTALDAHWHSRRELPFPHAWAPFDPSPRKAEATYRALLAAVARAAAGPYNLLVTRDYLLVVPRTQERTRGISLNALAFAGSLFVPDAESLTRLRTAGPLQLLREVCPPSLASP